MVQDVISLIQSPNSEIEFAEVAIGFEKLVQTYILIVIQTVKFADAFILEKVKKISILEPPASKKRLLNKK